MLSEMLQGFLHRGDDLLELGKILVMRRAFFGLAPEIFDRVVVRRIAGQLADRQTLQMLGKELFRRFGRVILGPVLDQKEVFRRLHQHAQQEGLVTVRVEFSVNPLMKQPSRKEFDQTERLVGFALARRLDRGRLTAPRPRIAQRPPLRETRFIPKQNPGFPTACLPQDLGPFLREPRLAARFVEMIGDKLSFLKRVPQVPLQFAHGVAVVQHAELTPNQLLDQKRVPAGRFKAGGLRSGIHQVTQAFLLTRRQLGRPSARVLIDQTLQAIAQQRLNPPIGTGEAEAPPFTERDQGRLRDKMLQQCTDPAHQPHIASGVGSAQTLLQGVDSLVRQVYSDVHGCILLHGGRLNFHVGIHPFHFFCKPGFSNSFSQGL